MTRQGEGDHYLSTTYCDHHYPLLMFSLPHYSPGAVLMPTDRPEGTGPDEEEEEERRRRRRTHMGV